MKLFIKELFIFTLAIIVCKTYAQTNDKADIGVFEHLNDTVPLHIKFTNEKGLQVSLQSLINKPTVLSFVYFDCPGLCSPLLDGISNVIEAAKVELGKDYQVITISFNFRDTPEKAKEKKETFLKKHSKSHSADWIYLTGDSASIYKVSEAAGFRFKRAGNDFVHPAVIIILSPGGKITKYLYGISFKPSEFEIAIANAKLSLARPTINKVLEFCYSYDSNKQKYIPSITKIIIISIIAILLLVAVAIIVIAFLKKRKNL